MTDENQECPSGFTWGDLGRWIGRGGVAEGLRSGSCEAGSGGAGANRADLGGCCARVVTIAVVNAG